MPSLEVCLQEVRIEAKSVDALPWESVQREKHEGHRSFSMANIY